MMCGFDKALGVSARAQVHTPTPFLGSWLEYRVIPIYPGVIPRFLQIRLGNESCDQISASPNGPKRLSHVMRPQEVYLLVSTLWLNSVKLKGVSSRFITK